MSFQYGCEKMTHVYKAPAHSVFLYRDPIHDIVLALFLEFVLFRQYAEVFRGKLDSITKD